MIKLIQDQDLYFTLSYLNNHWLFLFSIVFSAKNSLCSTRKLVSFSFCFYFFYYYYFLGKSKRIAFGSAFTRGFLD